MARITRLTENDLTRLVRRVIKEQPIPMDGKPHVAGKGMPQNGLPECSSKMTNTDTNGRAGGGSVLKGNFNMITSNGSVAPQYQGYTIYQNGTPFCIIKRNGFTETY